MTTRLPRSNARDQGLDPSAILAFVDGLEAADLDTHSLMVVRHGAVVAEGWWAPYSADCPHQLYSLTKSFTSTAIGLAVSEGRFALDDHLVDLFPDLVPESPAPNLEKVRLTHLLTMTVGHDTEPGLPHSLTWREYVRRFFEHPIPHNPGEHFLYNTAGSNMLGIVIQKVIGQTLEEYLEPRLFEPCDLGSVRWTYGGDFVFGGHGLYATTEAVAKFGLLYLSGDTPLPPAWAKLATRYQVPNGEDPNSDWCQGYGFQFWRCRHNAYRGDGAFGQFCIVFPQHDCVVAITSGGDCDMQKVLDLLYDNLLPGFDRKPVSCDLEGRLQNLELAPRGGSTAPIEPGAFGAKDISVAWCDSGIELTVNGSRHAGRTDRWSEIVHDFQHGRQRGAIKGFWRGEEELFVKICNLSTPNWLGYTFHLGSSPHVENEEHGIFTPAPVARQELRSLATMPGKA